MLGAPASHASVMTRRSTAAAYVHADHGPSHACTPLLNPVPSCGWHAACSHAGLRLAPAAHMHRAAAPQEQVRGSTRWNARQ